VAGLDEEVAMTVSLRRRRRVVAALAASSVASVLTGVLTGVGPASAASDPPLRYFQAAVNIPPDSPVAEGFAGSVSMRQVVGGPVDVSVFLSRSFVVTCADGEETASQTVRTVTDEATDPGPVTLDIDRLLRTAHGEAVVDLVLEDSPGCGLPDTSTTVARRVAIDATGTSDRFHTGVSSTIQSDAGLLRTSSEDQSRDGVGSASIGNLFDDATGTAFLKYAVQRSLVQGTPPQPPANSAPPGGIGATGAHSAVPQPPDGLGVVFEDMSVTAMTTARPEVTTLNAFSEVHTQVACPAGGTAVVVEEREGAGPGTLDVDRGLGTATASASLDMTLTRVDGCSADPQPVTTHVQVPVALALTATGPEVRVRDIRFHEARGDVDQRSDVSYRARDAAGTVTVGDLTRPTGEASISQARR
jgi:hypothetical protein